MGCWMTFFRLFVSPIFIVLAWINYGLPSHLMHGMMGNSYTIFGVAMPLGVMELLGSMWLMYALMGVAHITPWITLIASFRSNWNADY